MDKLEKRLNHINKDNIIKNYFNGSYNIKYEFKNNCNHTINKKEEFISIELDIDKIDNIYEILNNLILPEYIDQDNKLFCDKCKKNIHFSKRLTLKICLEF